MARGIQLSRSEVRNANHWHLRALRMRIEVVDVAGDIDPQIFVYQRTPVDPNTGQSWDVFQGVASPVDMVEYPAHEPSPVGETPFFRLDYVELDFRSTEQAMELWTIIQREAQVLAEAMDRLDDLEVVETVWVGDEPASEASEASEESGESASSL